MTLNDFVKKYSGKKIDYDGHFGAQCMDLYRFYVKEVWEVPQTPSVISASKVFDTVDPKLFEKFTKGVPEIGDVITWGEDYAENGHIAVVMEATPSALKVFEQNNPKAAPCKIGIHTYKHVIGWFRPRKANMANYYVERPSAADPAVTEIGVARDVGSETIITWAPDPAQGDLLTKFFKPSGTKKLINK